MSKLPYETEWLSRNVVNVRCRVQKPDQVFWFLLTSDVHFDNTHCDRKMYKRLLDEALERDAGIIDNGDLFCAMQGKWDPRSDQSQLRPEYQGNNYLDLLVDSAADFLEPYSQNLIALGHGNHETNQINRNGTDLTERLCATLHARTKSPVRSHWIAGWVLFRMHRDRQQKTIRLYRHHGYGGGAPVTRGVIQTNRTAVQYPDAHVCLSGHDHNEWVVAIPRMRITMVGKLKKDVQLHIRSPGFKDAVGDGAEGWENVKGHGIKSKGAIWLKLYAKGNRFHYEAVAAK